MTCKNIVEGIILKISSINDKLELEKIISKVLDELKFSILNNLDFKKAKILTYWINDWNEKFLLKELSFNPYELIKYKRGSIVNIHLGFNIGSEQGGLHYAIVIDNNNDKSSSIITIVPLRSLKEDESPKSIDERFELYIGEAILTDKLLYVEAEIKKIECLLLNIDKSDIDYTKLMSKKKYYEKDLSNLKKGSVAIVSQIRTVSKMRIFEPTKSYHSLSNFVLKEEIISKIDNMIKTLFLRK